MKIGSWNNHIGKKVLVGQMFSDKSKKLEGILKSFHEGIGKVEVQITTTFVYNYTVPLKNITIL